jgi:hypothetical protein
MNDPNPYAAPTASIETTERLDPDRLEALEFGQKLLIWSIIAWLLAFGTVFVAGFLGALFGFLSLAMSLFGVINVASGLGYGTLRKVILVLGLFVPFIGFLIVLLLVFRAVRPLREAGYRIGLFGATKPKPT